MYQGQARLHDQAIEHIQLFHGERVELTHSCGLLEPGRGAPTFMPIRLVITDYQVVFKCEGCSKDPGGKSGMDELIKDKPTGKKRSPPIFYVPLMCIYSVWKEDGSHADSRRLVYIQTKTVQIFLLRFHLRYPQEYRLFDSVWKLLTTRPYQPTSNYFCWAARQGAAEHGLLPSPNPLLSLGHSEHNCSTLTLEHMTTPLDLPNPHPEEHSNHGAEDHAPTDDSQPPPSAELFRIRSAERLPSTYCYIEHPPTSIIPTTTSTNSDVPLSPPPNSRPGGSGHHHLTLHTGNSRTGSPTFGGNGHVSKCLVMTPGSEYNRSSSTPCTPLSLSAMSCDDECSSFLGSKSIMEAELFRMAPNSDYRKRWRICTANVDFKICQTYPDRVILPAAFNDFDLTAVAAFRGQRRFPMISWIHPSNGSVLARCSQPLRGPTGFRSSEDEHLVSLLVPLSDNPHESLPSSHHIERLAIADARGYASALGNVAKGGGSEVPEHYQHAQHLNLDLPNIHTIRECWSKLGKLSHVSCDSWTTDRWHAELVNTGWLPLIQNIIQKAFQIALFMEEQASSVLVHCTDGWDRTSQLCGLAALLMDPYYRTIRGFQILIEKEWLMAGHRFAERCGTHGEKPNDFFSPIFLQWMDCVWQVWRQHSTAFEFNDTYLAYIIEHVYSCRFGTFLCNSHKERVEFDLANRTLSLWDNINAKRGRFLNILYDDSNPRLLVPSRHHSQIVLWDSLYFSFHCSNSVWRQRSFGYVTVPFKLQEIARRLAQLKARVEEEENLRVESMVEELVREIITQAIEESDANTMERQVLDHCAPSPSLIVDPDAHFAIAEAFTEGYVRWVPDHLARTCAFCHKSFTMFRRRHHCRSCGRVFCHDDCKPLAGVRTCRKCATKILEDPNHANANASAAAAALAAGSLSPILNARNSLHRAAAGSIQEFSLDGAASLPGAPSGPGASSTAVSRQPTAMLLPHLL